MRDRDWELYQRLKAEGRLNLLCRLSEPCASWLQTVLLDKESLTATEVHRLQQKLAANVQAESVAVSTRSRLAPPTPPHRFGTVGGPLAATLALMLVTSLGWTLISARRESTEVAVMPASTQEPETPLGTAVSIEGQSNTSKSASTTVAPMLVKPVTVADVFRDGPWVSPPPPGDIINYRHGLRLGLRSAAGVSLRSSFGLTLTENSKLWPEWIRWTLHCEFRERGPCQISTLSA